MTAPIADAPSPETAPGERELLRLEEVDAFYGRIQALRGVSLSVNEAEIVTLIGANGAGKTTTLKTISGLVRARNGKVFFGGEETTRVEAHKLVTRGIGHAPEGRRIFSRLTVQENLQMGGYTRSRPEI
jgi:branched-chain amino acid transport system ATP-binding protein